jgi:hypothetical protein
MLLATASAISFEHRNLDQSEAEENAAPFKFKLV